MIRDLKAGRMVMLIVAILAEFFLRLTIQRVHEMKEVRYQNGLPNGAARFGSCNGLCSKCTAPSGPGYCPLVGHADRGDGRVLVPHPIESHILRLIYGKKTIGPNVAWMSTGSCTTSCARISRPSRYRQSLWESSLKACPIPICFDCTASTHRSEPVPSAGNAIQHYAHTASPDPISLLFTPGQRAGVRNAVSGHPEHAIDLAGQHQRIVHGFENLLNPAQGGASQPRPCRRSLKNSIDRRHSNIPAEFRRFKQWRWYALSSRGCHNQDNESRSSASLTSRKHVRRIIA